MGSGDRGLRLLAPGERRESNDDAALLGSSHSQVGQTVRIQLKNSVYSSEICPHINSSRDYLTVRLVFSTIFRPNEASLTVTRVGHAIFFINYFFTTYSRAVVFFCIGIITLVGFCCYCGLLIFAKYHDCDPLSTQVLFFFKKMGYVDYVDNLSVSYNFIRPSSMKD
jgi:hypothetical protein